MHFVRHFIFLIPTLTFLLGGSLPLSAQVRTITLNEAIRLALQNNPNLRSMQAQVNAAGARARKAQSTLYPSVELTGDYRYISDVARLEIDDMTVSPFPGQTVTIPGLSREFGAHASRELSVNAAQPLFTGGKLRNARAAALEAEQSAESRFAQARRQVVYDVRTAFYQLLKAAEIRKVAEASIQQIGAHLRDVGHLVEQGMARRSAVLKVQLKLSEAELEKIRVDNMTRLARARLLELMAVEADTAVQFTGKLAMPETAPVVADPHAEAQEKRAELAALDHGIRAAERGVKVAKGARWPDLAAFGSYRYGRPGYDILNDRWVDYWVVGLNASINLWDWGGRKADIQERQAEVDRLRAQRADVAGKVRLDVTQSILQLREASDRLAVLAESVEQAEESFRLAQNEFIAGQINSSEFLDAETDLTRARLMHSSAIADYLIAQANYDRAIGLPR